MCRGATDQFQRARFVKFAKLLQQVAIPFVGEFAPAFAEVVVVKFRERLQLFVVVRAFDFAFGQIDQAIEMSHVSIA